MCNTVRGGDIPGELARFVQYLCMEHVLTAFISSAFSPFCVNRVFISSGYYMSHYDTDVSSGMTSIKHCFYCAADTELLNFMMK